MVAGANQYLRKPPDISELLDAVRKQSEATKLRRYQTKLTQETQSLNAALKTEIEQNEPHIWQGRASVELVHDLNNPLTVVIGYAALMGEEAKMVAGIDPARGKKLQEYSRMIERAAEYCHHLADNWRQASKKTEAFSTVDLVAVIDEVRQVILFSNAAIQMSGLETAMVRGSKFELMRIFQNLLKNSLEAGARRVEVRLARTGPTVELTIADNGTGMSPEDLKRALRGGFTSKHNGTGLGLSICRHLLGAHGATFQLDSAPGRGTTARITFPSATTS